MMVWTAGEHSNTNGLGSDQNTARFAAPLHGCGIGMNLWVYGLNSHVVFNAALQNETTAEGCKS